MVKETVEKAFKFFANKKEKEIKVGIILLGKIFESFSGFELTTAWISSSSMFFELGVMILSSLKEYYNSNNDPNQEEIR